MKSLRVWDSEDGSGKKRLLDLENGFQVNVAAQLNVALLARSALLNFRFISSNERRANSDLHALADSAASDRHSTITPHLGFGHADLHLFRLQDGLGRWHVHRGRRRADCSLSADHHCEPEYGKTRQRDSHGRLSFGLDGTTPRCDGLGFWHSETLDHQCVTPGAWVDVCRRSKTRTAGSARVRAASKCCFLCEVFHVR